MKRTAGGVLVACAVLLWLFGLLELFTSISVAFVGVLLLDYSLLLDSSKRVARQRLARLGNETTELTPSRLQAIAETARQNAESLTLFKFLASCRKISVELLQSVQLVDIDSKLLQKKLLDKDFRHVRRDVLRNLGKKLTHPMFGISSSSSTEDKYRGFEIVEWLATNFSLSRTHAVELGQVMHKAGFLVPLKRGPVTRKTVQFGDKMRHWRFEYAAIDKEWPMERQALKQARMSDAGVVAASVGAAGNTGTEIGLVPTTNPPTVIGASTTSSLAPPVTLTGSSEQSTVPLMGPREWQYLFSAGRSETFPNGAELISCSGPNDYLFRVTKGTVRIEAPASKTVIIREEGFFGEESSSYVMGHNTSSVSAIAEGSVTVQMIDSPTLAKLLKIEPVVSKVFWRWLAASFATRLHRLIRSEPVNQLTLEGRRSKGTPIVSRMPGSDDEANVSKRLSYYFPEWSSASHSGSHLNGADRKPSITALARKMTRFSSGESSSHSNMASGGADDETSSSSDGQASSSLIKHFNVRHLSTKSQLYVTPKGIGVLSLLYKAFFKQTVSYDMIVGLEQKSVPNRKNGTDFMLNIQYRRKEKDGGGGGDSKMKRSNKIKELNVQFESSEQMKACYELIEHLRSTQQLPRGSQSHSGAGGEDTTDFLPFQDFMLTPDDWQRLLEKATVKTFPKGHCLALAGSPVTCLYRIIAGTVRMVSHGAQDLVLACLGEGEFVSDSDFALMMPHSLTFIAESEVECTMIDVEYLRVLFVQQPELASRFYRHLCSTILDRVEQIRSTLE